MKLEKISENQIKCTLTSFELSDRNIKLSDLAYGGDSAKKLFSEMIQKAQADLDFEIEGTPFMIEAVPMRDGSIELTLTKVMDPDDCDVRFAKLTAAGSEEKNQAQDFLNQLLEGAGQVLEGSELVKKAEVKEVMTPARRVFSFNSLDEVMAVSKKLFCLFEGKSVLYKNPTSKKYFLLIDSEGRNPGIFASTCNVLSEYASPVPQNYSGESYLNEHYEVIVKGDALKVLANI